MSPPHSRKWRRSPRTNATAESTPYRWSVTPLRAPTGRSRQSPKSHPDSSRRGSFVYASVIAGFPAINADVQRLLFHDFRLLGFATLQIVGVILMILLRAIVAACPQPMTTTSVVVVVIGGCVACDH